MRTLIASLAAMAALGLAAPVFAQSETESPATPAPSATPTRIPRNLFAI